MQHFCSSLVASPLDPQRHEQERTTTARAFDTPSDPHDPRRTTPAPTRLANIVQQSMPEAPPKQWQSPIDRTLSTFANMHPSDYPTPQATGLGGQASTSGSDLQDDNSLRARMEEEMKIALILNKNLSPDYIMTRPGGGGNKLSCVQCFGLLSWGLSNPRPASPQVHRGVAGREHCQRGLWIQRLVL